MSKTISISCKVRNRSSNNAVLKRSCRLKVWLDPEVSWLAIQIDNFSLLLTSSFATIQRRLFILVFLGTAITQTTGFVESLLRFVSVEWPAFEFRTLSSAEVRRC
ncbi:transposase [Nioella sp. MMSF_3534]|uniref:transposase n=1 Tax=Nioella sp. MMSF_3534 TaxID=3046720 RepID=UPI003531A209